MQATLLADWTSSQPESSKSQSLLIDEHHARLKPPGFIAVEIGVGLVVRFVRRNTLFYDERLIGLPE